MIDVEVPTALLPQVVGLATGAVCDQLCAATVATFDGSELAGALFGFDATNGPTGILAQCGPHLPSGVAKALGVRGLVLLNQAGRLGITIGYGRVVEPAGRQYAIVTALEFLGRVPKLNQ